MTRDAYAIETADWRRDGEIIARIRRRVFIDEQGVSESLEIDANDRHYLHVLARDAQSRGVGTARLLDDGHIGRMAVLRDWRGRGVGAAMLHHLLGEAEARGLGAVRLHAQTHAQSFYAMHGFVVRGVTFIEAGIEHIEMTKRLTDG